MTAIEKLRAMAEWFGDVIEDLNDRIESVTEAERVYDAAVGATDDPSDLVGAWLWARDTAAPTRTNVDLAVTLQAYRLARDCRMAVLAKSSDPTEQLDDGSLLRVTRIERLPRGAEAGAWNEVGFRIEHVTRSGGAPEQTWDVDEHGRAIR